MIVALPDHWVVRELTERDYGIDLMVEIFLSGLKDKKNLDAFEASGALFHIQIKGTQTPIKPVAEKSVSYGIKKTALRYVEKFSAPFFLFRADVSSPSGKIYFVWLQRYIRDVLDAHTPFWRDETEDTISISIPVQNEVNIDTLEHIQKIALRPKYLEELIEFREIFHAVDHQLSAMFAGQHDTSDSSLQYLRTQLYRVRRLGVLLAENDCCINRTSVDDVIQYLHGLDFTSNVGAESRTLPHRAEFILLFNSLDGIATVENAAQESEGRTMY